MVSVPVAPGNGGGTVALRPVHQQRINRDISPEAFGAAVARGLSDAGRGVGQASNAFAQLQDFDDTNRAKDADRQLADWTRERMYGDGGFMLLEGRAAVDARADFEREWEEQRKAFGAELRGGAARKYDDASQARRMSTLQSTSVHAAQQRKVWFGETSAARVAMFADDALTAAGDPAKVDFSIAAGQAELRQRAEMEGWDPAKLAFEEQSFVSGVHSAIATRMAASDPIAAWAYLEEHREALTGVDQMKLEDGLGDAVKSATAKSEAARIVEMMQGGEPVDVATELSKIADDDIRIMAENRIGALLQTQVAAQKALKAAAEQRGLDTVLRGGTPDDLSIEDRMLLGGEGEAALWRAAEAQARRGQGAMVSDQRVLADLRVYAATDPAGFAEEFNPIEFAPYLTPTDLAELTKLKTGTIEDQRKGASLKSAFDLAKPSLDAVGLSVVGLTGERNKADRDAMSLRIAQFQNALSGMVTEFFDAEGRQPNEQETQAMVDKLLLPIVVKQPHNGFFGIGAGVSETPGFLFDANNQPDGTSFDVNVAYDAIPADQRRAITQWLKDGMREAVVSELIGSGYGFDGALAEAKRRLDRMAFEPTQAQIVDGYERFVLGR